MLEGKRSADVFAIYYQHARPMIVINLPSSVQHCFTLALPSKISFTLILRCSALCRACLVMHCSTCFLHLRTLLSLRVCHLRKSLSEFIFFNNPMVDILKTYGGCVRCLARVFYFMHEFF